MEFSQYQKESNRNHLLLASLFSPFFCRSFFCNFFCTHSLVGKCSLLQSVPALQSLTRRHEENRSPAVQFSFLFAEVNRMVDSTYVQGNNYDGHFFLGDFSTHGTVRLGAHDGRSWRLVRTFDDHFPVAAASCSVALHAVAKITLRSITVVA